jgi:hypothetical protein
MVVPIAPPRARLPTSGQTTIPAGSCHRYTVTARAFSARTSQASGGTRSSHSNVGSHRIRTRTNAAPYSASPSGLSWMSWVSLLVTPQSRPYQSRPNPPTSTASGSTTRHGILASSRSCLANPSIQQVAQAITS